jgi:hypothetical protein
MQSGAVCTKAFLSQSEVRRTYASNLLRFSQTLKQLILSQNPENLSQAESLAALFDNYSQAEVLLADAELRAAEDLHDIIIRREVLLKCNEDYSLKQDAYNTACQDLNRLIQQDRREQTDPNYERAKPRFVIPIAKAKVAKQSALDAFKSAIERLMDIQTRYTLFRIRRLTHAWMTYGQGMKAMCQTENDIFPQIKTVLMELRATTKDEELANRIESDINLNINAAPPTLCDSFSAPE